MEITLEKIELVKDRTGASYKEAKEALEACDGSVVDAIISIEETINDEFEGVTPENFKDSVVYKKMKDLVDKGNMSRIVIKKDDELIMNFPLTAGVVGALLVPWGVIFGIIATVGFKCKVEFINHEGETVDINGKVVNSYNKAKDAGKKYADKGQDVLEKIKDSDAYETIKNKGQEAYTVLKDKGQEAYADFKAEGGAADKINEWAAEKSSKLNGIAEDMGEKIKTEIDKFDDTRIKDNIDEFKKQAEGLFKKKATDEVVVEDTVSDIDAACDIDAVIDEIEKEISLDN